MTTPTQGHPHLVLAKQYTGGPVFPSVLLAFTPGLVNTDDRDAGGSHVGAKASAPVLRGAVRDIAGNGIGLVDGRGFLGPNLGQ